MKESEYRECWWCTNKEPEHELTIIHSREFLTEGHPICNECHKEYFE